LVSSKIVYLGNCHSRIGCSRAHSFSNIWTKNNTRELDYDLRNQDEYSVPFIRIEQFRRNPLVSLPMAWSELCDELRFQRNRTTFKIALNNYLFEQINTA
jgi:hypothetical protein